MYGVKPLSVHQSCSARIRYGRVDVPAVAGAIGGVMAVAVGRARDYLRITFSDGVSASM